MLQAQQRAMKAGLSKRMKAEAQSRRCPKCGRGYALNRAEDEFDSSMVVRYCRYDDCDYERWIDLALPVRAQDTEGG